MSKKIYIRVDKPIEVGDLVRCVEERGGHPIGQVRKVRDTDGSRFWLRGCALLHDGKFWEPVHKLKVGDRVALEGRIGYPYKICTVSEINPSIQTFNIEDYPLAFRVTNKIELYQPEKHDPKPIWGVDYGKEQSFSATISSKDVATLRKTLGIPTAYDVMDNRHRQEFMKAKVAEMIVELLDKENADWSNVGISINPEKRKTVVMDVKRSGMAICSHRANPDTLTGVYVALCKATGRKLPDWIYGDRR